MENEIIYIWTFEIPLDLLTKISAVTQVYKFKMEDEWNEKERTFHRLDGIVDPRLLFEFASNRSDWLFLFWFSFEWDGRTGIFQLLISEFSIDIFHNGHFANYDSGTFHPTW